MLCKTCIRGPVANAPVCINCEARAFSSYVGMTPPPCLNHYDVDPVVVSERQCNDCGWVVDCKSYKAEEIKSPDIGDTYKAEAIKCYGMYMRGPDAGERDCDTCSVLLSCRAASMTAKMKVTIAPLTTADFGITAIDTAVDPHVPGAKLDQGKTRPSLIFSSMPYALMAVAEVGTYGANKYSENGWMEVPNGIARYTDAMYRHLLATSAEDGESGLPHLAHACWNLLAVLELKLRGEYGPK